MKNQFLQKNCLVALGLATFLSASHVVSSPAAERTMSAEQIVADAEGVADAQLKELQGKIKTNWVWATMYAGYAEFAPVSKKGSEYTQAAMAMGKQCEWTPVFNPLEPFFADDHAIGQTILDLYGTNRDEVPLKPLQDRMDSLVAEINATAGNPHHLTWWWCDALFMAPPVLARLSAITGDRKYIDAMDKEWWKVSALLYDKDEHLFFRDWRYVDKPTKNGKKRFWARGNGWVVMGLIRVLQWMPKDYPTRPAYETQFRDMMGKIASLQSADGSWRTSMLDPEEFPNSEASGTLFFTYAMAWGINNGYLNKEKYMPVIAKAWSALLAMRRPDGLLGYTQGVADNPGQSFATDTRLYGTGGFLFAAKELKELAPFTLPPPPVLTESVRK